MNRYTLGGLFVAAVVLPAWGALPGVAMAALWEEASLKVRSGRFRCSGRWTEGGMC